MELEWGHLLFVRRPSGSGGCGVLLVASRRIRLQWEYTRRNPRGFVYRLNINEPVCNDQECHGLHPSLGGSFGYRLKSEKWLISRIHVSAQSINWPDRIGCVMLRPTERTRLWIPIHTDIKYLRYLRRHYMHLQLYGRSPHQVAFVHWAPSSTRQMEY